MDVNDIKLILNQKPKLRNKLFARGFILTNSKLNENEYPFYGLWKKSELNDYTLLTNEKEPSYILEKNNLIIGLVGHAYNPIDFISIESELLERLIDINFPSESFWNEFNKITGNFTLFIIKDKNLYLVGDASGMQTTFYGVKNNQIFISSHTNLIGDLLDLKWDPYIKHLTSYKFFKLLGNSLPGDLTQFKEVKRLIPNHFVSIDSNNNVEVNRFYTPKKKNVTDEEIVDSVSTILSNSLKLIAKKWEKPAISMTGGCDSKTTLSCANGICDQFDYFSYVSSESEEVDAVAANKICSELGLEHKIYTIPDKDEVYKDIEDIRNILFWNSGGIRYNNKNDVRKRIYFSEIDDFDVEIKSWGSEIGRSYYSKRFNERKNFGKQPSPRVCTTLYKFFLHDRKLVKETDNVFKEYIDKYFVLDLHNPVEWQEQFFWEFRVPSWNGLVITGEHRYSFEVTIPYNNRLIYELLLSTLIDNRINDFIYEAIRKKMNSKIDQTGIAVTNLKHTKNREKMENLYYIFNSKIPF